MKTQSNNHNFSERRISIMYDRDSKTNDVEETKDTSRDRRNIKSKKSNASRGRGNRYHNSKGKGKSPEIRSNSKHEDDTEFVNDRNSKGYVNDPRWYQPDADLADSVAQWSFSQPAGENIVGNNGEVSLYPSIMKFYLEPTPEVSDVNGKGVFSTYSYKYTGLNSASRSYYNAISSMTGRTSAYTPDDISILFLGIGEIISMFAYARHIMHLPYMINLKNKAIPDVLIAAYGFDPKDLRDHLTTYRSQFNTLIVQAQSIIAPGNIPYFEKCAELYSHIYVDSPSDTAQTYIFAPYSTWVLDEKYNNKGSGLRTTAVPGRTESGVKLSSLFNLIATMISEFQESSTYNVVGQDILHLNSRTNMPVYTYQFLGEFETTAVEYNENALLQIHNMTFGGPYNIAEYDEEFGLTPMNDVSCSVDKLSIFYNPAVKLTGDYGNFNVNNIYMDSLSPKPDADMRIDATRYSTYISKNYYHMASQSSYIQFGCGDHRCVSYYIYAASNNKLQELSGPLNYITTLNKDADFNKAAVQECCFLSAFDWSPFLVLHYNATGSLEDAVNTTFLGDLNYITPISAEVMNNLNRLSEQFLFTARISKNSTK